MEFTKEADAWYYEGDRELPLKQSCAEDAVDEFSKLEGTRRLTGAEEMASYGLDDPAYEIRLTDENGKESASKSGTRPIRKIRSTILQRMGEKRFSPLEVRCRTL